MTKQTIDSDQPEPSPTGSAGLAAAKRTARQELGDFTATTRVVVISLLAIGIGSVSAAVALALLRLINLFTNLFFYGTLSFEDDSAAGTHDVALSGTSVPPPSGIVWASASVLAGYFAGDAWQRVEHVQHIVGATLLILAAIAVVVLRLRARRA